MAISITPLLGTDSISSSRITVNDNLNTITDALNDVLSIIDIATGKINNYGYGSNNDMETEDLTIRGSVGGGISVISGNITVNNGNVAASGYFELGSGSGVQISKVTKNLTTGSIPTINVSGDGSTGGTGPIGALVVPRLTTAVINDIRLPQLGSIVFDVSTLQLKVCTASGATGTWTAL